MRSISGEFSLQQTDTEATTARRGASDLRRAGWSCAVGSAMEYYDFALYAMASSFIFGPVFFPTGGKFSGLIASFATYFVGFAVRPLGGLYFGRLGDLYGRKLVLMLTITLMGISSTAIGLIPSYATIGIAAPVLLVLMRVLQGFGAGAEQAGASVMMAEYAPEGRRGFFASIPLIGVQIGMAVATMVYLVTFFASHETVLNWAWRVPFLCGAVILAVALYMRLALKESPAFRGVVESHHQEKLSLTGFFRKCRRPILIGMGLRLAENGGSSIFQALAIGYLEKVMGVPMFAAASLLLIANMFGIPSILAAGFLSDRFGRVKIYRRAAFAQAILAFPAWYAFSTGNIVLAGIGLCAGLIANTMMYGSQAALLAEMFGVGHRYGGVAVTREFSAVFSGGIAPLIGATIISWVAERHADLTHAGSGAWVYLAAYLAAMSVLTFAVTFIMRDPINRSLQASEDFC